MADRHQTLIARIDAELADLVERARDLNCDPPAVTEGRYLRSVRSIAIRHRPHLDGRCDWCNGWDWPCRDWLDVEQAVNGDD